MNTFRCSNCGFQIQRPTQPFSCPQCGRQAVGLFRVVGLAGPQQGGWPGQPAMPQQPFPVTNPPQAGTPQAGAQPQGLQPPVPGNWPGQPQAPQAPVNPWGQTLPPAGIQPQVPGVGWPPPQQSGMPQQAMPQQGFSPQGGWPMPTPQQPVTSPPAGPQPPIGPQMPQRPMVGGWPGQAGIPQQPISPQPYQQPGIQPPTPQGWPGGVQRPPGGQWPAQQGAAAAFPPQPTMPPAIGTPGIPAQSFAPRYPQPPAPPSTAQSPLPQPQKPGADPGQGTSPPVTGTVPTPPPAPKKVAPGRTAFPAPPGAVQRPATQSPQVGAPPESPEARKRPAQPERKQPPVNRPPQAPSPAAASSAPGPAARPAPESPPSASSRPSGGKGGSPLPADHDAIRHGFSRKGRGEIGTVPAPPAAAPKPVERPKKPRPERLVWSFPADLLPEEHAIPLRNAPAVDSGGRVFLQYRDRLAALIEEENKPKLLWEYVLGARAPGSVVLGPQDTVGLHCCDGLFHCLDALTGKQIWPPAAVGDPLGYAVPVTDRDGSTYISAAEGGLLRVDSQGRAQKPQFFRSRQKFDSPAVLVDGVLYVGSEQGYLFAVEVSGDRGVSKWNHAGDHGYVGVVRSAPIVTSEKVLVVAGRDECLYGVAATGTLAWKAQLQGQILGSPVADRHGCLYLGLSQTPRGREPRGALACLDGNSHKLRWEYRTDAPIESTPVIGDDDVIYFGDNSGVIHAVDFSGKPRWTADVGSPVRSAGTLLAPHRLAFGLDNDSLIVLDCSSSGLAAEGWPKFRRTLAQNGVV